MAKYEIIRSKKSTASLSNARNTQIVKQRKESAIKPKKTKAYSR